MQKYSPALLVLLFAFALFAGPVNAADLKLSFDHYYDGPAVIKALNDIHDAYPEMTKLKIIGQSEEEYPL